MAQADGENTNAWMKLHAVLTALEQIARIIEIEDFEHFQKVLLVMFELPSDKYLAFRFVSTELVEDLSYLLKEKDPGT